MLLAAQQPESLAAAHRLGQARIAAHGGPHREQDRADGAPGPDLAAGLVVTGQGADDGAEHFLRRRLLLPALAPVPGGRVVEDRLNEQGVPGEDVDQPGQQLLGPGRGGPAASWSTEAISVRSGSVAASRSCSFDAKW